MQARTVVAGAAATALGMLFIGPLAIRALAAAGHRSPIGTRLALRDLARYQAVPGRRWPRSAWPWGSR